MFDILLKAGWIILPLILCSIVAVTIITERLFFFGKIGSNEIIYATELIQLVKKGKMHEALELGKSKSSPLLHVLTSGIVHSSDEVKAMEATSILELSLMKRGLFLLDTIITLSPLLGLLGTIIGMIDSFQIMAQAGLQQPHAVTGGVAEALIATAIGISVAVITLIPYNYFLSRIERETEMFEHYATQLEIALTTVKRSDTHENTKKYA